MKIIEIKHSMRVLNIPKNHELQTTDTLFRTPLVSKYGNCSCSFEEKPSEVEEAAECKM